MKKAILSLWRDYIMISSPRVRVLVILSIAGTSGILAAIWAVPLSNLVKGAITACLVICLVFSFVGYGIYGLVIRARMAEASMLDEYGS